MRSKANLGDKVRIRTRVGRQTGMQEVALGSGTTGWEVEGDAQRRLYDLFRG